MKLFLFGGSPSRDGHADVEPLLHLIEAVIRQTGTRQILHIPFARTVATEPEWAGDRFHRHIHIDGLEYLNAANPEDMKKVHSPTILINGGKDAPNLLQKLDADPSLVEIIRNADCIIAESAGAKVLCDRQRIGFPEETKIVKGLGILHNTIISPHYIELSRQSILQKDMADMHVHYGIGIDSSTGIECDPETFPVYTKIGEGVVELKVNADK